MFLKTCYNKPKSPGKDIVVDGKKYELVKQIIDTQYIKVKETKYKKGEDIYHDTTIYVNVPVLDSTQIKDILSKYYAKNIFQDTINIDTLGKVVIYDTVQYNKLVGRFTSSDVRIPSITTTTIVKEKPRTQLYIGGKLDYEKNGSVQNPGVGLMMKTKRDKLYGANISLTPNGNPVYGLSFYIKIGKRND